MKNLTLLFITITLLFSCQKVIDVDLNDANPKLVIEANYTAQDSTVRVLISYTANYFSGNPNPTVNNASVQIIDQNGISTTIPFNANGAYILSNYIPQFNTNYTMNVIVNGVTYSSSCFLPAVVNQEPITTQFLPDGFFGSAPFYLTFWRFNDPVGEENYYQARVTYNDTIKDGVFDLIIQDDKLINGNLAQRPIFTKLFQQFDTVEIEMRSISKTVYNYYYELQSLGGGQNSAAPANPSYYWTNKALGYFSCYGTSTQSLIIQ